MSSPPASRRALWIALAVGVGLVIGLWAYVAYLRSGLPSVEELANINPALATKILDRNGQVIKELYTQRRSYVPLKTFRPLCFRLFWRPRITNSMSIGACAR
ncbi:MAG: hypothetical protein IPH10_01070 [bacterium]|nr:hypothetical protein [bacterium]